MNFKRKLAVITFTIVFTFLNAFVFTSPAMAWTYRIKKGDSLFKLAKRYSATVNKLKTANRLKSNRIIAGRKLWIPDTIQQPMPSSRGNKNVYLLARLISGEARGETYRGQVAVGAVIVNRTESKKFPRTVAGNIFKRGQFESVTNGQIWKPIAVSAVKAAQAALAGWDPTYGALYFYNPAKITSKYNWIWSRMVTLRIGRHLFAV